MIITAPEMLLRIASCVLLGAAVGYERERSGRPAGLRTHLLVSLASAIFMLVSTQFVYYQHYQADELVSVDTSRIAASVVTGMGFLGAGAIMRTGLTVQGLTTAASLWLIAAVGLAAGAGMYGEAVLGTAITLFSLVLLRRFEGKQQRMLHRHVMLVIEEDRSGASDVAEVLEALGVKVSGNDYDRNMNTGRTRLRMDLHFDNQKILDQAVSRLSALPGVRRVQAQRPG